VQRRLQRGIHERVVHGIAAVGADGAVDCRSVDRGWAGVMARAFGRAGLLRRKRSTPANSRWLISRRKSLAPRSRPRQRPDRPAPRHRSPPGVSARRRCSACGRPRRPR
jgi:hypothetical protein